MFFLGPARVLLQERETTAEGVRVKGRCCLDHRGYFLFGVLYSTCVLFPSPRKDCAASRTQDPSVSKTLSVVLPHSTFLDLTTQTGAPDDPWEEEITGWDPRSTRDPSSSSSFWPHQPDATSRLGPDLVPRSRPVRTDDEMSVQEHDTTHVSVHTSFSK